MKNKDWIRGHRSGGRGGGSAETISRLQRGVLKLALSFHGQHRELDERLQKLGVLIRQGTTDDRLQRLIDEIVDTIVSQIGTYKPEEHSSRTLCDLLRRIDSKIPESRAFQRIHQQLSMSATSADIDRAIEDAANTVAQMVTQTMAKNGESAATSCKRAEALNVLLDRIEFPVSSEAELEELKGRIRRCDSEIQRMHYVERTASIISDEMTNEGDAKQFLKARDQLLLLMNLIPFPTALTDRSSRTRRSIEKAETPAALYGCIPEIADLTAAMRVQLQAEIDGLGEFLKGALQRLSEFEAQLRGSHRFHEHSVENAFDLEQGVGGQIKEMRADISRETDIEVIKAAVVSHLDSIDRSLSDFIMSECDRHKQARDKVANMVEVLNELEFEAKELHDNLEKQHLEVLIDPLTGILNRTGYNENINKEYARWRRYNSSLSLAVIDLDRFKVINNTYGHNAGDKVLATVAQQIQSQIRECDILCRYGGEEFVLLLPETSLADGITLLDKLRRYIAECKFHYQTTPVPVTLSCGIAEFHKNDRIEDVFDRADQAMYLAKRSGRNQCQVEQGMREEYA